MSNERPTNNVHPRILEDHQREGNSNLNDGYVDNFGYPDYRSSSFTSYPSNNPPEYRYQTLTEALRLRQQRFRFQPYPNQTFFQPPEPETTSQIMFNGKNGPPPSRDPRLQSSRFNTLLSGERSDISEPINLPAISPVGYGQLNLLEVSSNAQEHRDSMASHSRERSPQPGPSSSRGSNDFVNSPMSTTDDDDEEDPYINLAKRIVKGTLEVPKPRPRRPVLPPTPTLEDAYSEYVKCVPIPPRSETQTEPFTSSDPLENRDNSPTRWRRVRELKDDEERKTFARQQFGNQESANPAQNFTYHGYRRTVQAEDLEARFRPHGDYYSSNFVHIVDGDLEYIDRSSMRLLEPGRKRKRESDETRTPSPTNQVATVALREFEAQLVRKVRELKLPELLRTCSDDGYDMTCTRDSPCPTCSRRRLRNWEAYLKHFKAGMISSRNFLGFYFGQSKHGQRAELETRVPYSLLKTGIEIEEMFAKFNLFFGPNQDQRCRDCQINHIF